MTKQPPLQVRMAMRMRTRPGRVDLAMIVAAALSFVHHVHGAGLIGILVWWAVWGVLWFAWKKYQAGLLGAAVSVVVLGLMLFGPRTDLGFALNRSCFETKAEQALASHNPTRLNSLRDWREESDRCGLMTFEIITIGQRPEPTTSIPSEDWPVLVYFHGAGERKWGLFDGNGIVYSPELVPQCTSGVFADTHGCIPELIDDGWYYYDYSQNLN